MEVNSSSIHPNGRPFRSLSERPCRNDQPFSEKIFPKTETGMLLEGLVVTFLTKQEHRRGWARKSACDDPELLPHPNETVASHQWGVAFLISAISREPKFIQELPEFDKCKAYEMALIHDVAELEIGDITPVDGISTEEKHRLESKAMKRILGLFPQTVQESLGNIYQTYEDRQCCESKFVKDCDKLDFMIHAFLLERQGFAGFSEFYENAKLTGFSTKIATNLADVLVETRNRLKEQNCLYKSVC